MATDPAGALAINLLGPFELVVGGKPVALTTGRLRALLAVLAMSAGDTVTAERLAIAIWGDQPPADPRRSIQVYMTRIRGSLGAAAIMTSSSGYALRITPDQVDALRFLRLLDRDPDPATERVRLAEALALWRGTPFDGIRSTLLERTETSRLLERYLAAVERRIELDLASGHHDELVVELTALTARHPLRETLWLRLLVTLDRCGRQAEALERYETVRRCLADELGVDPGPELRRAYTDLLAGRPLWMDKPRPAAAGGWEMVIPRQLPPDIDSFTGRETALAAMAGSGAAVHAISGTAGVGKTTLAVHWAHQLAADYPDGQLYVNLRGFGPTPAAMEPDDVIRGFLDALGVPPSRIPLQLAAQTTLYRTLLAGKRVLVVLDNARDAGQVRPLLPGNPACRVIVTSRNRCDELASGGDAHPVALDLMPPAEARELLARRLGQERIGAEPDAVDTIIAGCDGLPLTLAIAAARAATATFPLGTVAAALHDAESPLDSFSGLEASTDLRLVFSWSYQALSPAAARLFRLLGLHPGPDITVPTAASLSSLPPRRARELLGELSGASLVAEHTPGRYRSHDLLRAYAAELADQHHSGPDRRAAVRRLLDHFLHNAIAADRTLAPHRDPITPPPAAAGVARQRFGSDRDAMAWFTAEHPALLGAVALAVENGLDRHTYELAWACGNYFYRQGHWHDWVTVQSAALVPARRQGDLAELAGCHRMLAHAYRQLWRFDDAGAEVRIALDLSSRLADPIGQAHADLLLARILYKQARYEEALRHAERALDAYEAAGHPGRGDALNLTGDLHARLGRLPRALALCREAYELQKALDGGAEATSMDSLGYVHHRLGQHRRAIAYYERARDLRQGLGHQYDLADTWSDLGDAHAAAGGDREARDAWHRALDILVELGHPDAERVRAKLAATGGPAATASPSTEVDMK